MRFLIHYTSGVGIEPKRLKGVTDLELVGDRKWDDEWGVDCARGDVATLEDLMTLINATTHVVVHGPGYRDWIDPKLPVIEIYDSYRE